MDQNICKFATKSTPDNDIFAYQFVYEANPALLPSPRSYGAFCLYLVTEGSAMLETESGRGCIKAGDLFATFPDLPFSFGSMHELKYIYLTFIGPHASDLLATSGLTREQPILPGARELPDFWFGALLQCTAEKLSMMAKGVLLYTLALTQAGTDRSGTQGPSDPALRIRQAIDQGYASPELSLEYLCRLYRYNSKYISRRFHETVGISFSEYLTSCRIRHACALLRDRSLGIAQIASSVGYRDPLYFSKAFKRIMGMSPTAYRDRL